MPVPPGRAFLFFDRALDTAVSGPAWLREPAVAQCVVDALRFGERHLRLYTLVAFCVMPNHIHTVVEPHLPIPKITKSIKGFTARTANQILGRTGERFWQDESHDHWIRNSDERNRIIRYTERNPVTAGLIQTAEQWPWSSASGT
jgi:REP element-mobilizing transposase RayT